MGLFSFLKLDQNFNLDSESFREKVKSDSNSIVLDVRTKDDFKAHIPTHDRYYSDFGNID